MQAVKPIESIHQLQRLDPLTAPQGLDYQSRMLDICQLCLLKYNVGERIPRIMVHCGHTFCSSCLSKIFKNNRIRCPLCRKLIRSIENIQRLPLNINILYEIVEKDAVLSKVNLKTSADLMIEYIDEEGDQIGDEIYCFEHGDRIKHFYCSNHQTVFCRECIRASHTDQKCFVVDLYEIQKMRQLQRQNITSNIDLVKKRQKQRLIQMKREQQQEDV